MTQEEFNKVNIGDQLLYHGTQQIRVSQKTENSITFYDPSGRFISDNFQYFELHNNEKIVAGNQEQIDELIKSCEKAIDFIRAPKHYVGKWPFGRMEDNFTEAEKENMVTELITGINKLKNKTK